MPEKFDLTIWRRREKHRPVMIHKVIYACLERFIALLTEHYAVPSGLAGAVQARILPISGSITIIREGESYSQRG
jgi:threonyl-tRNA synthetase